MVDPPVKAGTRYSPIPRGQHGLAPELVSADQRARLHAATVQAVVESSYVPTTVEDVLARAGVSRRTFYELYENKVACFVATVDDVVADWKRQGALAFEKEIARDGVGGSARARLRAGLVALFALVSHDPLGARILFIETLNAGSAGLRHLERAMAGLEQLVEHAFISPKGQAQISPAIAQVIVGGVQEIVTARLRLEQADQLTELIDPLVEWMISYGSPNAAEVVSSARAAIAERGPDADTTAGEGVGESGEEAAGLPLWRDDSARPVTVRDARERITAAAARIAAEQGYEALSINEIDRVAGVSYHTFRRYFKTKQNAFIAAYREGGHETVEYSFKAFAAESQWEAGVRAGLAAELRLLAMRPILARIGFLEVFAAGPELLEVRDAELALFTAALEPGYGKSRREPPPHRIFSEAIAGGIYHLIRELVLHRGPERLLELLPEVTFAALAPFTGASAAAAVAEGRGGG